MNNSQHNIPNVSVIILTYNGGKYIAPLLESLRDQSYPEDRVEIIVVDNASTDDTIALIKNNYTFVKLVPLHRNLGFAAGNNHGFLEARHDLMVFINQDTICHREWLRGLVKAMAADKRLAACNPSIVAMKLKDFQDTDRTSPATALCFYDLSPFGYGRYRVAKGKISSYTNLLSGCAFIIRREVVIKLGYLYDEQLWMYAEDTDLSLRIHNLGYKMGAVLDSVVFHFHNDRIKIHKKSLQLAARAIMNRVYVFFKNMGGLEFTLFFPFLFFGGGFKIFEFNMSTPRRALNFIPFSMFSMICMAVAVLRLPQYANQKRRITKNRRRQGFQIFKLVFTRRQ